METTHTPGPWSVVRIDDTHSQIVNSASRGVLLVSHDGSEEGRANERLAARAPVFLAELDKSRPVFLAIYIAAPNNTYGNPRRGWYVSRLDGQPVIASAPTGRKGETAPAYTCWVEEGYSGRSALDHAVNEATGDVKGEHIRDYLDRVRSLVHETGRINVTPGEYRDARKLPRFGGGQ